MTSETGSEKTIAVAVGDVLRKLEPVKCLSETHPPLKHLSECSHPQAVALVKQTKRLGRPEWVAGEVYEEIQRAGFHSNCFDYEKIDAVFVRELSKRLQQDRDRLEEKFRRNRGERYGVSTFESYIADTEAKQSAVAQLREYATAETWATGGGVILFGPRGTGKDHLATALAGEVIRKSGTIIEWVNGLELYADFRDSFSDNGRRTEREIVDKYVKPDVLYVSDPLPPSGSLTEFQMGALFRIVDARYCHCRATWITINVQDKEEMDKRLGPQNGDRLRDESLAIFCNWQSHRKPAKVLA